MFGAFVSRTYHEGNLVSKDESVFHTISSKIEISVLEAKILVRRRVVLDGERGHFARVQYGQRFCDHLDVAGGPILVFIGTSFHDHAVYLNHKLPSKLLRGLVHQKRRRGGAEWFHLFRGTRVLPLFRAPIAGGIRIVKDALGNSESISQIDKDEMIHISGFL